MLRPGIAPNGLIAQAIRYIRSKRFALPHEAVSAQVLARSALRLCPLCFEEENRERTPFMATQTLPFVIGCVVTCPAHEVPLVSLPTAAYAIGNHDMTALAREHCRLLQPRQQARQALTRIENYMISRLVGGRRDNSWLDDLPAHVVIRASEVFGLRALLGPGSAISGHSAAAFVKARSAGFDIICRPDGTTNGLLLFSDMEVAPTRFAPLKNQSRHPTT